MSALTPVNFKASVCFMLMKGGGGGGWGGFLWPYLTWMMPLVVRCAGHQSSSKYRGLQRSWVCGIAGDLTRGQKSSPKATRRKRTQARGFISDIYVLSAITALTLCLFGVIIKYCRTLYKTSETCSYCTYVCIRMWRRKQIFYKKFTLLLRSLPHQHREASR